MGHQAQQHLQVCQHSWGEPCGSLPILGDLSGYITVVASWFLVVFGCSWAALWCLAQGLHGWLISGDTCKRLGRRTLSYISGSNRAIWQANDRGGYWESCQYHFDLNTWKHFSQNNTHSCLKSPAAHWASYHPATWGLHCVEVVLISHKDKPSHIKDHPNLYFPNRVCKYGHSIFPPPLHPAISEDFCFF